MNLAVLLFENFETLDVFGPVEVFGRLNHSYRIKFYSLHGGQIRNNHGITIITENLNDISEELDIFLIPGGIGTRTEVHNKLLIDKISSVVNTCKYVLTVCTGSALLAKTGVLDHRLATTNKRAFDWVMTNGSMVKWEKTARWMIDGKFYTSSGISAGIDMALSFIGDRHGIELAKQLAIEMEYTWSEDKNNDSFRAE